MLLNQWITAEIKEEIRKYLETNENENTAIQIVWDAAKAVLRRKFIAIQACLRKQEKSQINNLTLHLKELEIEEETKPNSRPTVLLPRGNYCYKFLYPSRNFLCIYK